MSSDVKLTPRQEAAMRLFITEGGCNEGLMVDVCWPFICRPRLVTNGLLAKGLVKLGGWWGETGYDLELTDDGRKVVEALNAA